MDAHALRALGEVLDAVREAKSYPEMLDRMAHAVARSVGSDRATIYVHSRRRRQFLPAADCGTPASVVAAFAERSFGDGTFPGEQELVEGRSVHGVRGAAMSPAMQQLLEVAELHSLAVVPLIYQGDGEGCLSCGWHHAPGVNQTDVTALEQLAPHIALLIRIARLEAAHARLAERRRQLATWAAGILAAPDLDDMAARLCEATRSLFRSTGAALFLLDEGVLVPYGAAGLTDGANGSARDLPAAVRSAFEDARRSGDVLVLNEFRQGPYASLTSRPQALPAALLAIPLIDVGGTLGLLIACELGDRFRFGQSDPEDARLLGSIATVTMRKGVLLEELKRADRAKSEFLANVSHDLRTPLNVFLGYTQLLAEGEFGELGEAQADALARMERSARGQLTLINDLLDLARIEQGKILCHVAPVRVADLVAPLCEMMEALLRGRPISFSVDVPPDVIACTDPDRLQQVLVNLLGNAAKFTREGEVRLTAERHGDSVEIRVIDTGPGIEVGFAEKAIEPFVRGEGAGAGAGLGLAIVARLLRVLAGELAIDSAPGRGTTVSVTLPGAPIVETAEVSAAV